MNFVRDVHGFIDSLQMIIYKNNLINQKTKLLALEIPSMWIHQRSNCKDLGQTNEREVFGKQGTAGFGWWGNKGLQPHDDAILLALPLQLKSPLTTTHVFFREISQKFSKTGVFYRKINQIFLSENLLIVPEQLKNDSLMYVIGGYAAQISSHRTFPVPQNLDQNRLHAVLKFRLSCNI